MYMVFVNPIWLYQENVCIWLLYTSQMTNVNVVGYFRLYIAKVNFKKITTLRL